MPESKKPLDHRGRAIDFGRTADDYDRHRPGFPASMYERLLRRGWIRPSARTIDIGTGTGTLALGLASRGLRVVAIDPSSALLGVARRRAAELGLDVRFAERTAEDIGEPDSSADIVTAGQCWWWFDAARAAAEVRRVLTPGGRLLIANFCYVPIAGSLAERTEALVLKHNPGWPKAGETGIFSNQIQDLDAAGFLDVESFSYVEPVPFAKEAWSGRMRACNGVGAALASDGIDAFDRELAALLATEYPQSFVVPHRVFIATGRV